MKNSSVTFESLKESAKNLAHRMPTDKTYASIIREAKQLFNASNGSIYIELDGVLKRVYTTIPFTERVFVRSKGHTKKAFDSKEITVITAKDFLKIHPEYNIHGITHFVSVPLVYDNISVALLSLQFKRNEEFNKNELDALKVFSYISSLRIRNSILYEDLGKSLKIRDMFISLAIHELNTPITTLSGYVSLAKKKSSGEYLDPIILQLERINKIMDSFKKFHQIKEQSNSLVRRKFDLKQAVSRAIIDFRSKFPSYKIIIEESIDSNKPLVKGDLYKISQVFVHIFENAAKFSKDLTPIVVQIKKDEKNVIASIEDEGSGMSKKDLKQVMDGHYKASGNTQQGMGLGLYLSKIIIESHSGKINIKSKLGKGTQVVVKLPLIK
ncbi:HAMP domain-containing histidine kinase [Candidatus Microgenomates bacterium]|nr:HAMP domain-containing histidine kinase [Candidatus Microgenomates bacterium]